MDGYNKLPIAKSLHGRFGGWSFITHFNLPTRGLRDNEKEWHTKVFINESYELDYLQHVIIDKQTMRVVAAAGSGKLQIAEINRVFLDNGSPAMDYTSFQKAIQGEDLEKLFKANWDFSSIGFNLKTNPVENIQLWKDYWKRLYPKQ